MSDSLREQLLKAGVTRPAPAKCKRPQGKRSPAKPVATPPSGDAAEIDLARAYALRHRAETRDQQARAREAEAQARARKERQCALKALLDGAEVPSTPEPDQTRHFEYRGKIRRVHVNAEQLAALNAGDLGVVQFHGRYLVVHADIARQAAIIDPTSLALLVDPTAPASVDADGIPDDLMW